MPDLRLLRLHLDWPRRYWQTYHDKTVTRRFKLETDTYVCKGACEVEHWASPVYHGAANTLAGKLGRSVELISFLETSEHDAIWCSWRVCRGEDDTVRVEQLLDDTAEAQYGLW